MSAVMFFLTVVLMLGVVISPFHRTAVFLPLLGFVSTFFAGYLGSALLGTALNWPDAGAIAALSTMGAFILWALRHPKPPEKDGERRDG